jgi:Tol biopolymer transport system component
VMRFPAWALLALLACGESVDPSTSGSIEVTASTTGGAIDPDGYLVTISNSPTAVPSTRVPSNGSVVLTDLAPGDYSVVLNDIASNCTPDLGTVVSIPVPPRVRATAAFAVTCVAPLTNDLVFDAVLPGTQGLQTDIFRVNAGGSGLRNLTESPDREEFSPAWKPDGSKIAFEGGELFGQRSLLVMDPDGTNVTDLGLDFVPQAWSPNGTQLAGWVLGRDLYVVNSDGTGLTNLTNRVCIPGAECGVLTGSSWSPDGTRIVYGISRRLTGPLAGCWVIGVDGAGPTLVKESCLTPAWAPNADRIAFTNDGSETFNLLGHITLMNPDGTGTVDLGPVYGADSSDHAPAWSPDGSQIAFVSKRGAPPSAGPEAYQLYIMNADGTELRRVPIASPPAGIARPSWGPAAPN